MGALRKALVILFFPGMFWGPPSCAASLPLTPYPKQLELGPGVLHVGPRVRIEVASKTEDDQFAASLLAGDLKSLDGVTAGDGKGSVRVVLARSDSAAGKQILEKSGLQLPLRAEAEGYVLLVSSREAAIVGKAAAGIFYGVQTLRQLFHPLPGGGAEAPEVKIVDWPALRWRGVSLDISRGPIPTLASFERDIALLAEYKVNVVSPYMENNYAYPSLPNVAPPDGAITPAEAKELVQYAARYHVLVVPEQESFGHLHSVLQTERFQDFAEVPYGEVLSPFIPSALTFIARMFSDLSAAFPGPFFHIGADETQELGEGRTRAAVEAEGYDKVFLDGLCKIERSLRPYHRRILYWAAMGGPHPEYLKVLPHDLIAVTYGYSPLPSFVKLLQPYRDAGMEIWVAPGVSNWSRIFPDFNVALANIRQFITDGKALGATGVLNTTWMDDGESTVNFTWYGLAYGAAQSWQKTVDDKQFNDSWDWAFYRADGHHFVGEVESLAGIDSLLGRTVQSNGYDSLVWVDALSPDGQSLYSQMEPAAHQIRLTAEDVITDLLTNCLLARRNRDLLHYPEFSARRFDFLGQKAIYAQYISGLYSQAQADSTDRTAVRQKLDRVNQMVQDMGHQSALLRDLYEKLWLGENRPYFLGNILARYDQELRDWQSAANRLRRNRRIYDQPTLPSLIEQN